MIIEYDGTHFAGFQYQRGQRTVQGELEHGLGRLTREASRVAGAGRTDAGVHALGQVVSFDCRTTIPGEKLAWALNSVLPTDIRAVSSEVVGSEFHARYSAKSRVYAYLVLNRQGPSAMLSRYAWHVRQPLDVDAMAQGATALVGDHDFAAWANSVAEAKTTVRRVARCTVRRRGRLVLLMVEANAFLHGMVRNIVGTLVEVGLGRRKPEEIAEITDSRDRALAGPTAPAHGLCLVRVRY